ncbi:oligosaccharide flippase family protein [Adhaeribacter radiodurans]|uniref:Oligosaccharide flippase family protein n=1 Tax=Adhaeribacter radiodurans TaxID=2745197 RepID=A0A7L7LES3_9BACT|nr:oligosaccharide flippase family protein [Adhaeribacter radiodurans]
MLVKPIWLVLENNVQNQMGHAAFGTFAALFSFTFIFTSFTDLGIYHYFTKQMAAVPTFMATHLPVVLPFKTLISLIFPFIMLLAGWAIGYQKEELYYLTLVGFIFTFTQFTQFLRGALQAYQFFNLDSVMSVLERFFLIFIIVVLLYLGITLESYVYARLASVLLAFGILCLLFRKKFGSFPAKWSWQQLIFLLKASFPFAIINLVNGINEKIDMVMLERLASSREAGIYAGAYRWVDAVMMYLWTVLPIFFAKFAAHQHQPLEQQKLLRFGQMVVSIPIIFVCVFVFFYGEKLFWQFSNSSATELSLMHLNLQILFANVCVHGFFAIYANILTASNWELAVSKLVALSIVVNVTLNFIFIPVYGSLAAAVDTLISAVLVSGGYLLYLRPKLNIPVPGDLIFKLLVSGLALGGIFYGLSFIFTIWWVNTILAGIAFLGVLFLTRVIRIVDLKANLFPKK